MDYVTSTTWSAFDLQRLVLIFPSTVLFHCELHFPVSIACAYVVIYVQLCLILLMFTYIRPVFFVWCCRLWMFCVRYIQFCFPVQLLFRIFFARCLELPLFGFTLVIFVNKDFLTAIGSYSHNFWTTTHNNCAHLWLTFSQETAWIQQAL